MAENNQDANARDQYLAEVARHCELTVFRWRTPGVPPSPPPPSIREQDLLSSISERVARLGFCRSIPALWRLQDDTREYAMLKSTRADSPFSPYQWFFWQADVDARLYELTPPAFFQPVVLPETVCAEVAARMDARFSLRTYLEVSTAWQRSEQYTKDVLLEKLVRNTSDYPTSEDPRYDDILALPYPPRAIIKVFKRAQLNAFLYNFPFLVHACEWVKAKMVHMEKHPPSSYLFEEDDVDLPP